jgi:hypothetical protein
MDTAAPAAVVITLSARKANEIFDLAPVRSDFVLMEADKLPGFGAALRSLIG